MYNDPGRLNQVSVFINREGTFYGQLSTLEHIDNDRITVSARDAKQDKTKIPDMVITTIGGCSNHSLLQRSTNSGISMSNFSRFIASGNLLATHVFSVLSTRGKQIR